MRGSRTPLLLILGLMGLLMLLFAAPVFAADPEVVAEGLDNPRGITFGADGAMYVAEAGTGGDGPCFPGPEGEVCYGTSGSVTRILDGAQERIATSLPSLAAPDGSGAAGPHDVALLGGDVFVVVGMGGDPAIRSADDPGLPASASDMGRLLKLVDAGWESVADLSAYEAAENPDGSAPDTNPYAVLTVGDGFVVVDAGGNDLLGIDAANTVSTIATFADVMVDAPGFLGLPAGTQIPMQSMPTSVAVAADGSYYVGELTGFPFPEGAANVYMVADGQDTSVVADGFTNIVDIALEDDGTLWVLEIAANSLLNEAPVGALTRVDADGTREVVLEGLIMPGGVAVGPDNAVYVSNCGVCPVGGHILRLSLDTPEPPATGDYSVSPIMGALAGVFGITLVISGGTLVRRRGFRA